MRVIDALTAPWAIRPEMLQTMLDIYERHERGEVADKAAIEAAIGKPLNNERGDYTIEQGVAVIDVLGVLSKRMDLFTEISGGASTQRIQKEFNSALGDSGVHSIILAVDSPGGSVDGIQPLVDDIFAARGDKQIVALIDGVGASGAYWIASAADQVFITDKTAHVGSIGVVLAHKDVSKAESMRGVKTTEITAGKYKRIASNYAPLTGEGRDSLQEMVDHLYSVFVNDVARNRGVSAQAVIRDMADGKLFIGQQAIDAGLVDGYASLDALISKLNAEWQSGVIAGVTTPNSNEERTTIVEIKTDKTTPALTQADVDAAFNRGKAEGKTEGLAEGKALGIVEGATNERERIKAVAAQKLPGHKELVKGLMFDGKTTGAEAAVLVLKAEKEKRAQVGADLIEDAPKPVGDGGTVDPKAESEKGKGTKPEATEQELVAEATATADKARIYQAEQKALGRKVSATEAVNHVREQAKKQK